jgi:sortase B
MKAEEVGRKAIRITNSIINAMVLAVIVILLAYAGYALWDADQIYQAAEKSNWEIYKPTVEKEGKTFAELRAINPDVFAWIEVFGTSIDYPVVQGPHNMKYVDTDAEGHYSLTGAIFLDHRNSRDFSDFNSILYGHHMERKAMFGEIGEFSDRMMFDTRRYGNLYFDGVDHGLEFFAFLHSDGYNYEVFTTCVDHFGKQAYLDNLLEAAMHVRDIGITIDDRIILLSTCSSSSTNGRDVLVGRITDEVFENPFADEDVRRKEQRLSIDGIRSFFENNPCLRCMLLPILAALLLSVTLVISRKRKRSMGKNEVRRNG